MNYRKGRKYEYYWKNKLESQGYVVLRTAGSHSFADLIAISSEKEEILFIQIKTFRKTITPKQIQSLFKKESKKVPSWIIKKNWYVLIAGYKKGKKFQWYVLKNLEEFQNS